MARVHHKPCRLVDHQHGGVLVDHIEGNVLGHYLEVVAGAVHADADLVVGLYLVTGLYGAAVDDDASGIGSLLYAVARGALHARHQVLVDAQGLLAAVGGEVEVLIELAPVGKGDQRLRGLGLLFVQLQVNFFCHIDYGAAR